MAVSIAGFSGTAKRVREENSLWCCSWDCRPSQTRELSLGERVLQRRALHNSHSKPAVIMNFNSQKGSESAARALTGAMQGRMIVQADWTANQIRALRQELKTAEQTVEELREMLRVAECAVLSRGVAFAGTLTSSPSLL